MVNAIQCTILGQISRVAEGLSFKPESPVQFQRVLFETIFFSCTAQIIFFLQFFSAFKVIYDVVEDILRIFAQLCFFL